MITDDDRTAARVRFSVPGEPMNTAEWLLADIGYDADWFREILISRAQIPAFLGTSCASKIVKYDKRRYKRQNHRTGDA